MKTSAKWGIGIGVGIPGVLILIGLIGLLIKFFMKRCRSRAWDEINSLPKHRLSSEREPLFPTTTGNVMVVSDGHISIPIGESESPAAQYQQANTKKHEHTLVQIQRDRLNRLKEEENRSRPMLHLSTGELDIQRAIDQAQKEFEESV
ncbi:unnamed protein product [Rotaria sp. Silwood2]|nr:unnamed protein product [Rotaria sp. Silwood2]